MTRIELIKKVEIFSGLDKAYIEQISEYCVENTIRQAYHMDYDMIVVKDCIASYDEESTKSTLRNVEKWFGLVQNLEELSEHLKGLG